MPLSNAAATHSTTLLTMRAATPHRPPGFARTPPLERRGIAGRDSRVMSRDSRVMSNDSRVMSHDCQRCRLPLLDEEGCPGGAGWWAEGRYVLGILPPHTTPRASPVPRLLRGGESRVAIHKSLD